MAWIEVIDKDEASGELAETYDELARKRGKIANIMKVHSLNPEAMKRHLDLYMHLLFGKSGLSRAERESIAVVVSAANNCAYCVNHHAEALSRYEKDNSHLRSMVTDFRFLDLPDRRARMLSYALKLTTSPGQIEPSDVEELRRVGFSDRDILDIDLVAAYFNFVNRIALGLGVATSEEERSGYRNEDDPED
jgi:uncharacterized peroxidase-related enzyme